MHFTHFFAMTRRLFVLSRDSSGFDHRNSALRKLFDEAGVVLPAPKIGILHYCLLEGNGRLDAGDHVFAKGTRHSVNARLSTGGGGDDFGDHRIVVRRDGIPGIGMGVDSYATAAGRIVQLDLSGTGHEIVGWVFRVDAAFDGVVSCDSIDEMLGKMLTRGHLNLLFDKIASIDFLGDRMLDLDAGVHLHEIEMTVIVHEKLDRARIRVSNVLRQFDRRGAHSSAQFGRHERGGTLLDDLLIAALDRTIAFPEMNDAAMFVCENLKFNMVRVDDKLFNIDGGIVEGLIRFEARGMVALHEAPFVTGDAHPAAPAAGDRLDHDGKADFSSDLDGFFLAVDGSIAAWRNRHSGLASALAGGILVAHESNGAGGRTYELNVAARAHFREMPVFREESVARMNCVDVGNLRGADDAINLEIALRAGGRPNANGFIRKLDMEAFQVGLGIDGDSLDPELFACPNDPQGDFAAVGDEDFLEHA